jgi:BirA family biotin operon repressor/biotin-[acetyl-CoA-carboxylase] ligase
VEPIPEDLAPERIRERLTGRVVGRALEVHGVVESTNDLALRAGERGAPEGLCIVADRQAAGRGRRGRSWVSLPGLGLYASILLRPRLPADQAALLTLAAGLAAADAVQAVAGVAARLKWPNDVLLDGRKVVGILTEAATIGGAVSHLVVGIGINVNHGLQDFPPELRAQATSLFLATGTHPDRAALAAHLFDAMERWHDALCRGESGRIVAAARASSAILGRPLCVMAGDDTWDGVAVDLDADGALLVRDGSGTIRRLVSEEVSIRELYFNVQRGTRNAEGADV